MKQKEHSSLQTVELRRRAEEQLEAKSGTGHFPGAGENPQRLIHELQVHQIELEMQNAELRQARDEVETVLEQYADLYDFAPVGYVTLDPNGIIRAANLTASKLMGVVRSRLIGCRFDQFIPAATRTVFPAFLDKVFKNSVKVACEVDFLNESHSPLFVQVEAVVSESKQECRAVVIDITGRKMVEEAIRHGKMEWERTFDSVSEMITILDNQHRIQRVNVAMARRLGLKPKECIGLHCYEVVHGLPEPPESCPHMRTLRDGCEHVEEIHEECLKGDFLVRTTPLNNEQGVMIGSVQVIHDITERKKMQDELIKMQKLESLGVLAGGIAHDFNNILTGILGNLSFARLQIDPALGIARRLEDCEKATLQAGELTRQLLTFARGGVPVKKIFAPGQVIRNSISCLLRCSNVHCVTDVADDLLSLKADKGQLGQVLNNLLLNAAQAMPNGGVVILRGGNETLQPDNPHQLSPGAYIRIEVEDHGCGISGENQGKIFDPYFTTKQKGYGLGLASVYSIVKRHGGSIKVVSVTGVGSCFTLLLPAVPAQLEEHDLAVDVVSSARGGRILIMDDEVVIRDVVLEILQYLGFDAEVCADGKEALERCRAAGERGAPFDAVILDLTIPGGMGGKETAPRIRAINPTAVLIVSSGYSDDPVIANYHDYGFDGAISKPFNVEILARGLAHLIPGGRCPTDIKELDQAN